jgi:hypothetical protein
MVRSGIGRGVTALALLLAGAGLLIAWQTGSWSAAPRRSGESAQLASICSRHLPSTPKKSQIEFPSRRTAPTITVALTICQPVAAAGASIHAVASLHNASHHAFVVISCPGQPFDFGIANSSTPFTPAFTDVNCGDEFVLPPGVTQLSVRIGTRYLGCSMGGASGSGANYSPACISRGGQFVAMPPLPAGTYEAKLVVNGYSNFALSGDLSVTLVPIDH